MKEKNENVENVETVENVEISKINGSSNNDDSRDHIGLLDSELTTEQSKDGGVQVEKKGRKQRTRGGGSSSGGIGGGKNKNTKYPLTPVEIEVIKSGELARVLCARMGSGTMTADLVALSPSCGMWREAALSYSRTLQRQGKLAKAKLFLDSLPHHYFEKK
jgi:hypothetical protein